MNNDDNAIAECASSLRKQMMLLVRRLRRESAAQEKIPFSLLLILGRIDQLQEGATPTALAEVEGLRPQNLSALLRKLEQMGLTYKEFDTRDKRKTLVRLTATGYKLLNEHRNSRDNWLARAMLEKLSHEEITLLQQAGPLLERLSTAAAKTRD